MRGYEAVWTDLSALRYDISYCESLGDFEAVSWPIVGRFKARNGVADCCMIPIAGVQLDWALRCLYGLNYSLEDWQWMELSKVGHSGSQLPGNEPWHQIIGMIYSQRWNTSKLPPTSLTLSALFGTTTESSAQDDAVSLPNAEIKE